MSDFATLRIGAELAPRSEAERSGFLRSAGLLDRGDCPPGFAGHSAVWARDHDLLIGQGALVELSPEEGARRLRLIPPHLDRQLRVMLIDMLAVRFEYRETGLEERMVRKLIAGFADQVPRPSEALIYIGAARAPVLLSTVRGLGLTDDILR